MLRILLNWTVLVGVLLYISACNQGDGKASIIVGKWSYQEFQMGDQKMTGDQLGNPTMHFMNDETYDISFGEMSEKGKWRLEGDNLITVSQSNEQDNSLLLVEVSESKLVLEGEAGDNKIIITLVPFEDE